jgi:transposase
VGAQNWACLVSLIETCNLNSVNPNAWLTDVLIKLPQHFEALPALTRLPFAVNGLGAF